VSTLTATADPANSFIRLDLDYSDVLATHARITRTNADGTQVDVRPNAFARTLTTTPANTNQTFEGLGTGSVQGWFNTGGTVARAADQTHVHSGLWAMMLTPNGVAATPFVESDKIAVTPSQQVQGAAWLYNVAGYSTGMRLGINWYDAASNFLSTSFLYPGSTGAALPAATFTAYGSAQTGIYPQAPAGAFQASLSINYLGTPSGAVVVWADDARIGPYPSPVPLPTVVAQVLVGGKITLYDTEASLDQNVTYTAIAYADQGPLTSGSQTYDQGPVIGSTLTAQTTLLSQGTMWLKDPTRPANSIRVGFNAPGVPLREAVSGVTAVSSPAVTFQGLDAEKLAGRSSAFDVNNRNRPVAVTRSRSDPSGQLFLITRTLADRDALTALLRPGGQVLLQVPPVYGVPDSYLLVGDETISRIGQDHRYPRRVVGLPYQVVDLPPGPSQGVAGARWSDLCNRYATAGALMAGSAGLWDTFTRTLSSAWGTPDTGAAYTLNGSAADFSTNGASGVITLSATNLIRSATSGSFTNSDLYGEWTVPAIAVGAALSAGLVTRYTDALNYYRLVMVYGTSTAAPTLIKRVAGVETTLATGTAVAYVAGQRYRGHLQISGTAIKASIWSNTGEPAAFQLSVTDSALAGPGSCGAFALAATGNTNVSPAFTFDNLLVPVAPTWAQVMARAFA